MALKDTLARLVASQELDVSARRDAAQTVSEWQSAVAGLLARIRADLQEYKREGSIDFVDVQLRLNEQDLGSYDAIGLDILAGPVVLSVRPIARLVAGGIGRVDIHRQSRPSESERVILLRDTPHAAGSAPAWKISMPLTDAMPLGLGLSKRMRHFEPFTKELLEGAIELLLK